MENFIPTMIPHIDELRIGYDAYYIKFNAKDGYTYWIRYELVKKNGHLKGEVWFIRFDKNAPEIYKKEDVEDLQLGDSFIRFGKSALYNTKAEGSIEDISWNIEWKPIVPEIWYYEERWYKSKLLPTKATAPYPSMLVSGEVKIGDKTFVIEEAPGEIGHHWGSHHQKFWFYYHANTFEKPYMILGAGSKRLGQVINLMHFFDGEHLYSLRSLTKAIRKSFGKIEDDPKNRRIVAKFGADYGELKVIFEIFVPYERIIGVTYDDPKGPIYCYNSMIADGRLTVIKGEDKEILEVKNTVAFEIGTKKKLEHLKLLL